MGENECRKYFQINLYQRMLPDPAEIEPDHQSDAHLTEPSASRTGMAWPENDAMILTWAKTVVYITNVETTESTLHDFETTFNQRCVPAGFIVQRTARHFWKQGNALCKGMTVQFVNKIAFFPSEWKLSWSKTWNRVTVLIISDPQIFRFYFINSMNCSD